ncbi:helix-turn-helix domain-containing protein [Nocardia terpenica]|uniref:helix-turn-helix domain-containing protein n=1 Tax=Nocardia terpenica TaxID=455432 RepID=UPI001894BCBA|nr:helix-turn-helix transcriptional regulator [Nocardia terpenica]MBF6066051.1 helix-turn-helix domain-containing protein [Nocardia terpenica]MBF6109022.1 helix-turn-helix domain-containing protein [Nocardia terpenica]MBF6116295.1 helix-turn-helix domain-containing protein [Nocardia terpenica]MBF6123296.1 helix-turn-helix domain-containing protein [Nocardia terpenica]MBF6156521.1 helix-turn-helix domain-containing protein [Nocardia terpenica]
MAEIGSTLARRALGRQLSKLRERAKIKQAEAARLIGVSPQSISRMEDGLTGRVNDLFLNTLCNAYSATGEEREIILKLAEDVRTTGKKGGGWWRRYADAIPDGFDHYLALEDAASRITAWKLAIVPGPLQTKSYRRAVIWAETPDLSPEVVDMRLEIAARRRARLDDPQFTMDALLSEAVIRDRIGGAGVMKEELYHLVTIGEQPNVSIRIVPFDAPGHHVGAVTNSFVLLEFPELQSTKLPEPPVVYIESYLGAAYLELESEIRQYRHAATEISRVALDSDESRRMILAAAEEM